MHRILLLALVVSLSACDTDGVDATLPEDVIVDGTERIDLSTLSQDAKRVIGTWEWQRSTYFETASGEPEVITPASSGRTEIWMFLTDGRAMQYVNGELAFETDYEVRTRQYPSGARDARPSLQFTDGSYGFDFGTVDRLLVLDDTAVDGGQSVYRRK